MSTRLNRGSDFHYRLPRKEGEERGRANWGRRCAGLLPGKHEVEGSRLPKQRGFDVPRGREKNRRREGNDGTSSKAPGGRGRRTLNNNFRGEALS